ncbi:hypothetical protein PIB30_115915, partial [Stylosanthes scabra]|nr:hypothetical protein [Stylosanthes scabra]
MVSLEERRGTAARNVVGDEAEGGSKLGRKRRRREEDDGTEEDAGRTVVGVGFGVGSNSEDVRSVLIGEKD